MGSYFGPCITLRLPKAKSAIWRPRSPNLHTSNTKKNNNEHQLLFGKTQRWTYRGRTKQQIHLMNIWWMVGMNNLIWGWYMATLSLLAFVGRPPVYTLCTLFYLYYCRFWSSLWRLIVCKLAAPRFNNFSACQSVKIWDLTTLDVCLIFPR